VVNLFDRYRAEDTETRGDIRRAPRLEPRWNNAREAIVALLFLKIVLKEEVSEFWNLICVKRQNIEIETRAGGSLKRVRRPGYRYNYTDMLPAPAIMSRPPA
jgi:hypothetical protein